jgi:aryl-alcohol dehydrogenase-like predicted oxidoreductase
LETSTIRTFTHTECVSFPPQLTGKYNDGIPSGSRLAGDTPIVQRLRAQLESEEGKAKIEKVKKLTAVAKELNCSVGQLALAWCGKNENVTTVILGATKPEQLAENLG